MDSDRDHHKDSAKSTSTVRKLQQRTTTIALSILVAVSFGVVGLQMLSASSKTSESHPRMNGTKALTILAQEKEQNQAGVATNLSGAWNSQQNDAETVRELNKIQARKIKDLKRELNNANVKLHKIKSELFTKGDPSDRARLAEVCQTLTEKERCNEEFQKKISELESERDLRNQKITRMEQTIDALAMMTDTQRDTKEKAIFNLQSQIERLEEDAKRERNELKKTLAELEETNHKLKENLADKAAAVKTLEEEISWQYGLMKEKDKDLQSQSKLYTLSENQLQKEINHLGESLELEMLKNQSLAAELEIALAKEKAQEQYTRSLESQLDKNKNLSEKEKNQWNQNMVNFAKEYLELQSILDVYTHSHDHLTSKQTKLATLVKEEKSKVESLKEELDTALAAADAEQQKGLCIEEELHATAHKILEMEDELKKKQVDIESKQQELDTLTYSNASLRDQLHARIDQLTTLLEESQKEVRRKEASVRDLAINLELERTRTQEFNDRQLQQSEQINAMEKDLKTHQEEVNRLQDKVLALTSEYEQEKQHSNELQASLSDYESIYNDYDKLQKTFDENIDLLQAKLDKATTDLNNEQKKIQEASKLISSLNDELAQKEDKIEKLHSSLASQENQVDALIAQLEEERNRSNFLEDRVYSIEETGPSSLQIKEMQQTIAQLSKKVELERHRTLAYEKANKNQIGHTKFLEEKLENFSAQIAELQKQVDKKDQLISEMRLKKENQPEIADNSGRSVSYQHTVQEGENLGIISTYYYGTPNRWIDIYNANRKAILDQNKLEPGIVITIP